MNEESLDGFELSIDWSHVSDKYNWLAVDANGDAWLFSGKPETLTAIHYGPNDEMAFAGLFSSLKVSGVNESNWKQAIIERPKESIKGVLSRFDFEHYFTPTEEPMLRDPLDEVGRLVCILDDTCDEVARHVLRIRIINILDIL